MDKLQIIGGAKLNGRITISGAKNAALPLICAGLLSAQPLKLSRVPNLRDVASLRDVLASLGVGADYDATSKIFTINSATISSTLANYDLVRKMRASILVLGPLLARMGHARVSLPGGCAIGARPVDLHLQGLKCLGATIELEEGYIVAKAPAGGLQGCDVHFAKVSVGATENLLMAATLAKGTTTLNNAAREPEIVDLGKCLIAMGAKIEGLGSEKIIIHGVDSLHGADYAVMGDRIEAGTFVIAAAMTGGELTLDGCDIEHLRALVQPLHLAGVDMTGDSKSIHIKRVKDRLRGIDVMTEPYPGFPTDLQAQVMAMLTIAEGAGMVTETIFENRFMHVPELARMGAHITVHDASALVRGVAKLKGADVMATDLRASVSLVLAGLVAEGVTNVHRIYHLDRGYEDIVAKLSAVGANIKRLKDEAA